MKDRYLDTSPDLKPDAKDVKEVFMPQNTVCIF